MVKAEYATPSLVATQCFDSRAPRSFGLSSYLTSKPCAERTDSRWPMRGRGTGASSELSAMYDCIVDRLHDSLDERAIVALVGFLLARGAGQEHYVPGLQGKEPGNTDHRNE